MMSRRNITCHCNVCTDSTCITQGKCFSSVELDHNPPKFVQRCLSINEMQPLGRPMICQLHQKRTERHLINCCDEDLCNPKHPLPDFQPGDTLPPLAWIIPAVVLAVIVIALAMYLYSLATRNSHHASSKFTFTNFIFACLSAVGIGTHRNSNNRRNLNEISRINGCTSTSSGADSLRNIDMEAATSIMSSVEMPLLARGSAINEEDLNKLPHVNNGHSNLMISRANLPNCGAVEFITGTSRSQIPGSSCGPVSGVIGCNGSVTGVTGSVIGTGGGNSSIGGGSNFVGGRTSTSSVTTNTAARTDQTTLLSTILSDDNFSSSGSGPPLLIQRSIARQIDLKGVIGKGRFGEVFKGDWRGETVAVKIFSSLDEASWQREIEIYQTSMLRHENILGYISADNRDNGTWIQLWLITDYHEYGSLHDYLTNHTLTLEEMTTMAASIAAGLSHLHHEIDGFQGKPAIAHRDLKSKNILVKSNKTCAIADLGLAVRQLPNLGGVDQPSAKKVGTRRYLPPEVLMITDDNSKIPAFEFVAFIRGDIYSFGLILWELANRTAFNVPSNVNTNDFSSLTVECNDTPVYNQVPANDYQLPYHNMVSFDPTIEEMKSVVVDRNLRPPLLTQWKENATMKRMSQIMTGCWDSDPKVRLTTLRVKKDLSSLNKSLIEERSTASSSQSYATTVVHCDVNTCLTGTTISSPSPALKSLSCSSDINVSSPVNHNVCNGSLNTSLSSNFTAANEDMNVPRDNLISTRDQSIYDGPLLLQSRGTNETQLNAINSSELPDSSVRLSCSSSSSSAPSSSSSSANVPPSADSCSVVFSSDSSQSTLPVTINGSLNAINKCIDNDFIATNELHVDQDNSENIER